MQRLDICCGPKDVISPKALQHSFSGKCEHRSQISSINKNECAIKEVKFKF